MEVFNSLQRESFLQLFLFYCKQKLTHLCGIRLNHWFNLSVFACSFLLSTHYTHYDMWTFAINFSVLLVVLVAKLPAMHKVRVFGINKMDEDMD